MKASLVLFSVLSIGTVGFLNIFGQSYNYFIVHFDTSIKMSV